MQETRKDRQGDQRERRVAGLPAREHPRAEDAEGDCRDPERDRQSGYGGDCAVAAGVQGPVQAGEGEGDGAAGAGEWRECGIMDAG